MQSVYIQVTTLTEGDVIIGSRGGTMHVHGLIGYQRNMVFVNTEYGCMIYQTMDFVEVQR